ncbi:MAG: cytochrome c [Burkholderiales bacterium]
MRAFATACRAAIALAAMLGIAHAVIAQTSAPHVPKWTRVNVDVPLSDVIFPAGEGAETTTTYCLMCHSEGMVMRQPPMTQVQWLDEVRRMRQFFGAPIPPEQDAVIASYLARVNGPAKPPTNAK